MEKQVSPVKSVAIRLPGWFSKEGVAFYVKSVKGKFIQIKELTQHTLDPVL